ncbi:MAG: polysaccharide biosynthesis/export family protein, partial [Rhizobiaceae bacterium]
FIRNPDVSGEVERYRPFFIMGEVSTSGQYTYVPGMTVQNAIAIAGGYTARANQESVDITRQINGKVLTGRVPITDPILPSDTIHIRERIF